MSDFKNKGIYFLPLGGADDIGMNMFVYASNGKLIVVDAGFGFLNDEYPGMDMISYGPTLRGVHSPDERLEIKTVELYWKHTLEILKNI